LENGSKPSAATRYTALMPIKLMPVFAICLGASLGALARWQLSEALNKTAQIPLGTLAANWIGAYFIGIALAFFSDSPKISESWRLFLMTGLLGGLTTFSAFSAEVVQFIQQGRWSLVGMEILLHVGGSIALTLLGVATYFALR
jgi:CrcB protein